MYLTHIIVLIVLCGCSSSKAEESNEVSPKPLSLDMNLRRALLKALTELENEEKQSSRSNPERSIEKASASSFTILATNPTTQRATTEKPVVVFQKSNGLQHKPIITFVPSYRNVNETEQFLASATSRFSLPQDKPVSNFITKAEKIELTSPAPTVASPTTEENQAKVEDVQFLSAPLVAAFTVHQDEQGLPKSVEPIYKPSSQVPVVSRFQDDLNLKRQQILRQEQFKQEHLKNQIALQEKQRVLEEQLIRLQQQQKQQEEYLYKQQQVIQEQLKIQSHKLLDEKLRLQQNEQPFRPMLSTPNFSNQITSNEIKSNNHGSSSNPNSGNAVVSFQSSISLNPVQKHNELPLNAQHLPIKNPINFLQSPYVQPVFNSLRPPTFSVDTSQKIFRREPIVGDISGNKVIFSSAPLVQLQPPILTNNVRFLRSNLETFQTSPGFHVQQPIINQQLNNLLYNSGIARGKQIEDLSIISKVLSYNHVGGDHFFGPFSGIKRSDDKA